MAALSMEIVSTVRSILTGGFLGEVAFDLQRPRLQVVTTVTPKPACIIATTMRLSAIHHKAAIHYYLVRFIHHVQHAATGSVATFAIRGLNTVITRNGYLATIDV